MISRSEAVLEQKLGAVWPMLDERTRRLLAANEALALGYGGVSRVHRACGLTRAAITSGIREIEEGVQLEPGRVRRPSAGRKRIAVSDPTLLMALDRLIDLETRGAPESPLRWVCQSTRTLADGPPAARLAQLGASVAPPGPTLGRGPLGPPRPASWLSRELPHGCPKVDTPLSYTHLRAHETRHDLVCRLLLEKKKKNSK